MLFETGRIIAIEPHGLWVETIQLSVCGSCQAKKGCGHSLLAQLGAKPSRLWVLLDGRSPSEYHIGDEIKIGIPEDVIANGALFVYLIPLLLMLVATLGAHELALGDGFDALCALAGLTAGALIVRLRSHQVRFDNRLQPVLVDVKINSQTLDLPR